MADLTILDVGHGNCAVLSDPQGTVIIDAGHGSTLLEFLEHRQVQYIDAILISHADADHVAGVVALLAQTDIRVRTILLNADAVRRSALWTAFRVVLADARKRYATQVRLGLTTTSSEEGFHRGAVQLEILAPTPEISASGVGGQDLHGRTLSANAMSAVSRIVASGRPEILLTGDIDETGLENLLEDLPEPRARVLVFPHHGGLPGSGDPFNFSVRLCKAVQPGVVIFSIGRGMHTTPLPEIIMGVRHAVPEAHIACTQLSLRCAAMLPTQAATHLGRWAARGRQSNACCAGTLQFALDSTWPEYTPAATAHGAFVDRGAPTALCRLPSPMHGIKDPATSEQLP